MPPRHERFFSWTVGFVGCREVRFIRSADIRRKFLSFFAARDHTVVDSSSLVPAGDPTLLFTNSGMVQFKDVFLGRETRPYRRAASAQKCVRAGGKHNDLDAVGQTARHHTFFEMLGNWSFGDYFKDLAIEMAWTFIRDELQLSPRDLFVSVHETDDEAASLWRSVAGLPPERIVRLGDKDNFWQMADTGPCGPCSEIYVDRGAEFACGPNCSLGVCDCDRWLEIWNLVFMQYDRAADGTLSRLPHPSVDTGMGLERVASVLQGVHSNYETDLFTPLLDEIARESGRSYDPGPGGFAFRVLADHARAVTLLVSDGVMPANEGRGYVLRRILRRAVRIGRPLGAGGRVSALVPVVVDSLGDAYPELRANAERVEAVVRAEEERFLATLDAGTQRFEEAAARASGNALPGAEAFMLYDTYGFPLELTEELCRERGLALDRAEFEREMAEQRRRARGARPVAQGVLANALTDLPKSRFVGYDTLETSVKVRLLWEDGSLASLGTGEEGWVVLEPTPFYPEGGGQVGDQGTLQGVDLVANVVDTRKDAGRIVSRVRVTQGTLGLGMDVLAQVDRQRREGAMRNHTGTHVLHQALREILGDQVRQTGSLVAPDRLRFDFASPRALTVEDIEAVEDLANRKILEDLPVRVDVVPMAEAKRRGALMFFDEKYGEEVRVIAVGDFSMELCGGTHCTRSGQIGMLKIISETGIGAGMRRVEALTGLGSLRQWRRLDEERHAVAETLGALRPEENQAKGAVLVRRLEETERELETLRAQWRRAAVADVWRNAEAVGQRRWAVAQLAGADPAELRRIVDTWRAGEPCGVLMVGSSHQSWSGFVVAVSRDLTSRVDAGAICRRAAAAGGGRGGGRRDLAQGGANGEEGLARALETARATIREALTA